MRKTTTYLFSLIFVGVAAMAAHAQVAAPQPAPGQTTQGQTTPGQPGQAPPAGRGGGQQPMPPGPNPNSQYRIGPDSLPQEGVPKGEIRGPYTLPSQAYPARSIRIGSTCRRSTIQPCLRR